MLWMKGLRQPAYKFGRHGGQFRVGRGSGLRGLDVPQEEKAGVVLQSLENFRPVRVAGTGRSRSGSRNQSLLKIPCFLQC